LINYLFQTRGKKENKTTPLPLETTQPPPSHPRNNPLKRSLPLKKNTIPIPFFKGVEKEKYPISLKKQPLVGVSHLLLSPPKK